MNKKPTKSTFFLFTLLLLFAVYSCKQSIQNTGESTVRVQILSNPEMLNPLRFSDGQSDFILRFMFQQLTDVDYASSETIPLLADSLPKIEKTPDGFMKYTYRLRPQARWDNGSPVTARDIEFSLKALKNPKVNNPQIKQAYEHCSDFIYDTKDSLKFTIVFNIPDIFSESNSGGFPVIPEYFYDPKGLLRAFSLKQINQAADEKDKEGIKIAADPRLGEFADDFNSEKRMREKQYISGSGPYSFEEWTTGQRIVLKKKKNWWGDQLRGTNIFFDNNVSQIVYKIINDMSGSIVALKAHDIDLMFSIKPKDFAELEKNEKFKASYNTYTPPTLRYDCLSLNCKREKLADTLTRKAIAHLLDVGQMIQTVMYGYARQTIGPISPSKSKTYASDITPYDYNIEKAKSLLARAGWKDSDGDGILDKTINGKKIKLELEYSYNSGNDTRKQVGLLLQEEARKVGIAISLVQQEWSVFLENRKKHNFDIMYGAWSASYVSDDLKQIYRSDQSINGGSNYSGFGNATSDALIDSIRVEMNEEKRNAMYKKLQHIIHDDAGNIFLWSPTERMAISSKFENIQTSIIRPGFYEAAFKLK